MAPTLRFWLACACAVVAAPASAGTRVVRYAVVSDPDQTVACAALLARAIPGIEVQSVLDEIGAIFFQIDEDRVPALASVGCIAAVGVPVEVSPAPLAGVRN